MVEARSAYHDIRFSNEQNSPSPLKVQSKVKSTISPVNACHKCSPLDQGRNRICLDDEHLRAISASRRSHDHFSSQLRRGFNPPRRRLSRPPEGSSIERGIPLSILAPDRALPLFRRRHVDRSTGRSFSHSFVRSSWPRVQENNARMPLESAKYPPPLVRALKRSTSSGEVRRPRQVEELNRRSGSEIEFSTATSLPRFPG